MTDDRARDWQAQQDAMSSVWKAPPRPPRFTTVATDDDPQRPPVTSAKAAWITFALSLLLAPLAVVSLILGAILASKGRAGAGATVMVLSVLVLIAWYLVAIGQVSYFGT